MRDIDDQVFIDHLAAQSGAYLLAGEDGVGAEVKRGFKGIRERYPKLVEAVCQIADQLPPERKGERAQILAGAVIAAELLERANKA